MSYLPITHLQRLAAAVALGLALLAGPALAAGKLDMVGTFVNGDTEIDLATYTALNAQGVEERVGLVGLRLGDRRNSAAFTPAEWRALIDLWTKAAAVRSGEWTYVGDFTETGTKDVSHLKISGGPGVRFIVESPAKGAYTADLKPSDMTGFETALARVKTYLGTPGP
jgi:hypothetical protein